MIFPFNKVTVIIKSFTILYTVNQFNCLQVLAVQVFLFVISWLPYALVAQLGILGFVNLVTPYSAEIPVLLAKSSAVWNPIIYSLTGWSKNYLNQKRRRQQYNHNPGPRTTWIRSGDVNSTTLILVQELPESEAETSTVQRLVNGPVEVEPR